MTMLPPIRTYVVDPRIDSEGPANIRSRFAVAMQVSVAIVLLGLVAISVPRPNILLTNAWYSATSCDPATSSSVATAHVTLLNTGSTDGDVFVRFYVDGTRRAEEYSFVTVHSSVATTLVATLSDCFRHFFEVRTCYPLPRGTC